MIHSLLHISDTHGLHRKLTNLPDADLIVHSGDFTMGGSENEVIDFMEWFCDLPYPYKIFIAGNHDDCLYKANIDGLPDNIFYLYHSSIELEGIKFHGMPLFVAEEISGEYEKQIKQIPDDVDVLMTHQPPLGILDNSGNRRYGNFSLLEKVTKINPRLHLFEHIHNSYGSETVDGTIFSNASLVGDDYMLKHTPVLLL